MDHELAKALSHELRVAILERLSTGEKSPSELAEELKENLSNLAYHVRVLKDAGVIHQVKTKPVRGSTERFFRIDPAKLWQALDRKEIPPALRRRADAQTMQAIIDEGTAAIEAGTIEAYDESHLGCIPAVLDSQGCKEVSAVVDRAVEEVIVAQERSAKRLARTSRSGVPTTIILASFESAARQEGDSDADGK
jgi:DNA-binding transcriptional ArsR family regulator